MKRVAQICVEAAVRGTARRQLREDARAEERDQTARDPNRHHEKSAADKAGDDRWVHKDARADDAAHDDECGIPAPQETYEFWWRRAHRGNVRIPAKRRVMFAIATFVLAVLGVTVAQMPPPGPVPPLSQPPLESGSCLDSPRRRPKACL